MKVPRSVNRRLFQRRRTHMTLLLLARGGYRITDSALVARWKSQRVNALRNVQAGIHYSAQKRVVVLGVANGGPLVTCVAAFIIILIMLPNLWYGSDR